MSAPRRALVVRGGWEGHQPVVTTDSVIPFLREQGFEVRIEDGPAVYADPDVLAATDLILQCISLGSITPEQVQGLRSAVAAGTGLAGWHGGIVDSYRDCAEYLQLVGGQFAAHPALPPERSGTGRAESLVPHTVHMLPAAAEHPITRGIEDFDLVTEQYWVLIDDYCDVLATTTQAASDTDPWHRPVTSPALWTRRWGSGRIAVLTPGHDLAVLEQQPVRTLVERCLLWVAR